MIKPSHLFVLTLVLFSAESVQGQPYGKTDVTGKLTGSAPHVFRLEVDGAIQGLTVRDPELKRQLGRLMGRTVTVRGEWSRNRALAAERIVSPRFTQVGGVFTEGGTTRASGGYRFTGNPVLPSLDGQQAVVSGWAYGDELVVNGVLAEVLEDRTLLRRSNTMPGFTLQTKKISAGETVQVLDATRIQRWTNERGRRRLTFKEFSSTPIARSEGRDFALVRAGDRVGWVALDHLKLGQPVTLPEPEAGAVPTGPEVPLPGAGEEPQPGPVALPEPVADPGRTGPEVPVEQEGAITRLERATEQEELEQEEEELEELEAEEREEQEQQQEQEPAQEQEPEPEPELATHVVKKGESLYSIARGLRDENVTVTELMLANGMLPPDTRIKEGQELKIPNVPQRIDRMVIKGDELYHWIQDGDSPSRVAALYGLTLAELRAANPVRNLRAGALLRLPVGADPVNGLDRHQEVYLPTK